MLVQYNIDELKTAALKIRPYEDTALLMHPETAKAIEAVFMDTSWFTTINISPTSKSFGIPTFVHDECPKEMALHGDATLIRYILTCLNLGVDVTKYFAKKEADDAKRR